MITYAILTEAGGRQVNEDSIGVSQTSDGIFCVLADGLGGHSAGEVASGLVVETSIKTFDESTPPFNEILSVCMMDSQQRIIEEQRRQNRNGEMKTTATMLLIHESKAQWAHVGDSRVYRFDGVSPVERTLDHSVPQMLAIQGEIREKDIRHHEDRNRLIRAMGVEWESPKFTLSEPVDLSAPASFLLCSDGFWELIDEKNMSRCLKKNTQPEGWLADMEKLVLKNGKNKSMDNYSAIAVFLRG